MQANKSAESEHVEQSKSQDLSLFEKQDDIATFVQGLEGSSDYSEEEARRMTITYLLSLLDKNALGQSSIFGILKDTHLTDSQYSWANSIFYFGYLVAQYPASLLMQKLPIGRYFGGMIMLWGVVTACQASASSFAGVAVCRFFLGVFETCISPVETILVGQYWTTREHPLRAVIWWSGAAIGGFIGNAATYSISGGLLAHSRYAIWQVIFLLWGVITVAWGALLFFALPSSPTTAWFLTTREREVAVLRVIKNHTGIENRRYKGYQVKEALLDPQVWMLCALSLLQCIPGGALNGFDKIIIQGLGYNSRETIVMSFPGNAVQLTSVILSGAIAQVLPNVRIFLMMITTIIVAIGAVLINVLPLHQRLGPIIIMFCNTVPYIMCMSLVASNIGGFTKKATCSVMMFMAYGIGQIIAPQFFIGSEKPTYPTGLRACYISLALMLVVQVLLIFHLRRQNKKKEQAPAVGSNWHDGLQSCDIMDLTDKEHPQFRYVL